MSRTTLTSAEREQLAKLASLPDEQIDIHDIPEAPADNWQQARRMIRSGSGGEGQEEFENIALGLAKHKLIPFFGAGVSAPHLRVLWRDLSEELADVIGLPADRRGDFLKVADEYAEQKGMVALAEILSARLTVSEFDDIKGWAHLFLLSLNAGVLYTTNQDNLYELASIKKGRSHRVVSRVEDLAESSPSEALLVKYHGDLAHPDTIIFTGKSYAARIANKSHFFNIRMQSDLLAKGFLFIGYSFNDPNIQLLFREIYAAFGDKLPPSYLIAYEYHASMEQLHQDFGVKIIDPCLTFPKTKGHDEAFTRYLKAMSERVLHLKALQEDAEWFLPTVPPSFSVVTEYDVAAVVSAVETSPFEEGLQTYRRLLDRSMIPEGLETSALQAFKKLCDSAQTDAHLEALAAAAFNLSLPFTETLQAISRLMVAINRIDHTRGYPNFIIAHLGHGDAMIPMAAALAVDEIKGEGGKVNTAFRQHAQGWMISFGKLPPEIQAIVKPSVETAWRDGGLQVPPHLFGGFGSLSFKSAEEIHGDLMRALPQRLSRPRN
jgi:hypothetical protein